MTKILRPWALAALALGWLASASPAPAQSLKYVPNDAEVLISVNFQQIWGSKLMKDYQALIKQVQGMINAQVQNNKEVQEFQKALGIDLFNDVNSILVGVSEMTKDPKNWVMVFEGKFNPEKFKEVADKATKDHAEVVKSLTIGTATVYQISPPNDKGFFISLVSKDALVLTKTRDAMSTAINQAAGQPNLKQELATLVKGIDLKHSINFVATTAALQQALKESNNPQAQMAGPFLKDLNGMTMSANVTTEVKFQVGVAAKDGASAKKMAEDAGNGFAALKFILAQQAQQKPELAPVIEIANTLKADADGNNVVIQGTVSRKLIDDNIKKLEKLLP